MLYELHAGLYGGFIGGAAGTEKARELGITAVELMPINDFPGRRNWAMTDVLPYAPDRAYGSPDDSRRSSMPRTIMA